MSGQDHSEVLVKGDANAAAQHHDVQSKMHHEVYAGNNREDFKKVIGQLSKAVDESTLPALGLVAGDIAKGAVLGSKEAELLNHTPTTEEVSKAQAKVDGKIDPLVSDQDKGTLKQMQDTLLNGDTKGFSDAISQFKDNPDRLKDFIGDLNRNMKDSNAGVHAAVDQAGNVVVYGKGSNKAVEIGPDGSVKQREIERDPDGSVILKDGEVLDPNPDKVMKDLGNAAVDRINMPPYETLKQRPWKDPIKERPWSKIPWEGIEPYITPLPPFDLGKIKDIQPYIELMSQEQR